MPTSEGKSSPTLNSLWSTNTPKNFWLVQDNIPDLVWQEAFGRAVPRLGIAPSPCDVESVLALTLGEERFGSYRWTLDSSKRAYYLVKSIFPRSVTRALRRVYNRRLKTEGVWPIDRRYVDFLWEILRQVLVLSGLERISIRSLWPAHNRSALVLTHDIETTDGQGFVESVADLEESMGFRSSFNFVPEGYEVNRKLMENLRRRGFEVGVHGLRHNGRLFDSKNNFMRKAQRINRYLRKWNAVGFRAELTHRQPEWMQALEIEYDLSFFDTDPFEPIPGGTMSIWPFFVGHFVELPYTLVQDYTLTSILGERSPRIWLDKVDFIEKYCGMALVNSHPDYLSNKPDWDVYCEFLTVMKKREGYWHALPSEVANWWRRRMAAEPHVDVQNLPLGRARLHGDGIEITA